MAIILSDKYPGRSNPPSLDYPQGSIKDQSAPQAKDGTPLKADWANDHEGFFQSLLKEADITANGNVDTVVSSQYFDALKSVISSEAPSPLQATESVAGIAKVATLAEYDAGLSDQVFITPKKTKPSLSGSAVLTGTNNNIALTGIASSLGLEKGDVIRVVAGSYNNLHTVESLTNSDNLVVNYEHSGSRGNGSLKLPDYTGQVTISRVSKWYNASEGLGQDWVDVTSFRIPATDYTYSVPRHLKISAASAVSGSGNFIEILQGAVSVGRMSTGANETSTTQTSVSGNSTYRGTVGSGSTFLRWKEFR